MPRVFEFVAKLASKQQSVYASQSYRDERHEQGEDTTLSTEWFVDYELLKPSLRSLIPTSAQILVLGCGFSRLADELHDDGFENILACISHRLHFTARPAACELFPLLRTWS